MYCSSPDPSAGRPQIAGRMGGATQSKSVPYMSLISFRECRGSEGTWITLSVCLYIGGRPNLYSPLCFSPPLSPLFSASHLSSSPPSSPSPLVSCLPLLASFPLPGSPHNRGDLLYAGRLQRSGFYLGVAVAAECVLHTQISHYEAG